MSHLFYQGRGRKPVLDQARGVYMWDKDGKRYLDGSSGAMVCNIGHSNPNVLAAMQRQMEKSTFGYRLHFETEASEKLASKLAALAPGGLDKVFFVSGGSEAVESALKLARQYMNATGQGSRWKVISRQPSYHGSTLGALAVTGYTPLSAPFEPMLRQMPKIPAPRAYLDGRDPRDPASGHHYANMLASAIEAEGPETVAAFIVEPVGGASTGALVPPAGYMERIREICDRYGILMIAD
ncbi:MAG TPA: aspartate aminotransferase family protein, partial [Ruegeria sp.]|nr:aspartate aminotransferase family protein [Ruegeria sp.]